MKILRKKQAIKKKTGTLNEIFGINPDIIISYKKAES